MLRLFKFVFWILLFFCCGVLCAEQQMVNPVDVMQDVVIEEGTRQPAKTETEKQKAFRKMLLEKVFLKDMYSSEQSIYKPEPEEDDTLSLSSKGMGAIYGTYMRKQLAAHMAEQGFLANEVKNAASQAKR